MTSGALPVRRLRLAVLLRQLAITGAWLLAAAVFGGATTWAVWDAPEIVGDGRHYDDWNEARDVAVSGERHSRGFSWIMAFYDLEVSFVTADGRGFEGTTEFATALGGVDTDTAPVVRYDPENPERFVLSWAAESTGARYRFIVIAGLMFSVVALLFAWIATIPLGNYRKTRRCALEGSETVATLLSRKGLNAKGPPKVEIRYDVGDGDLHSAVFRFDRAGPLYLDDAESKMLALVHSDPEIEPILLAADFRPLRLNAAEQAATTAKLLS